MSAEIKLVQGQSESRVVQLDATSGTKLVPTPVDHVKNGELPRSRVNTAIESVTFPIERVRLEAQVGGRFIKSDRDAIIRMDGAEPKVLGYVGPDYNLIPHDVALNAAVEAMTKLGLKFEIGKVSLDRGGARMYTQFKFEQEYEIGQGDVLRPILTLVNGIDGYNALGFDLESIRLVCMNLARASSKDVSERFMHSKSADPKQLAAIIQRSLGNFQADIVPLYRKMTTIEVNKETSIKAVAVAIEKDILPVGVGQFAKHCVERDDALQIEGIRRTAWALFNAFTWASTKRGQEVTATRDRDIRAKIGKAFADGGVELLKLADKMEMKEAQEIIKAA